MKQSIKVGLESDRLQLVRVLVIQVAVVVANFVAFFPELRPTGRIRRVGRRRRREKVLLQFEMHPVSLSLDGLLCYEHYKVVVVVKAVISLC